MGAISAMRKLGVRGGLKSAYYSLRHTSSPISLLFHRNVITSISPQTDFEVNGRLQLGLYNPGASHPNQGRSVFTTEPHSTVRHTGSEQAIVGPKSSVHVEGELVLGDCRINAETRIICGDRIEIGDGASISWGVQILDDNRHDLQVNGEPRQKSAPIKIGDDVWIGHSCSITKGVEIGEGSIVASDSVVLDDIPPNTIAAGHPAEPVEEGEIDWVNK